jgi:hypothetical protein
MLTNLELKVMASESNRELPLRENEFTVSELLSYMQKAYGSKVNGEEFAHFDIINWIALGNIPESYGGHELTAHRMSGIRILVVEGLSRDDVRHLHANEDLQKEKKEGFFKKRVREVLGKRSLPLDLPQGKRTKLYYQMARLPMPDDLLPDNWRDVGIRPNQLKPIKRKKKK